MVYPGLLKRLPRVSLMEHVKLAHHVNGSLRIHFQLFVASDAAERHLADRNGSMRREGGLCGVFSFGGMIFFFFFYEGKKLCYCKRMYSLTAFILENKCV